jgi:hypothetical protein
VVEGFEDSLTGPIALNSVNSNTFSIADFEGSKGGGLTRVGRSAIMSENDLEDDGRVCGRLEVVGGTTQGRFADLRSRT